MRNAKVSGLILAVLLYSASAFAKQHGHGMGGGTGTAHHGKASGSSAKPDDHKTVSDILAKNSKLSSKLQTLTGMPAQQACFGFKNLGQCVAAAHVSKNLDISFACLKADMTGQAPSQGSSCPAGTGSKSMSLGKAIQTLSPGANHKLEARKAKTQADQDMKDAEGNS
jgi:hypothetical protein